MVSASTGRPYTEMENAFRYRQRGFARSADCACNRAAANAGFEVLGGDATASRLSPAAESGSFLVLPLPEKRPDLSIDPETRRNADGGLTVDALRDLFPADIASSSEDAVAAQGDAATPGSGRVRVVGPTFLPDL